MCTYYHFAKTPMGCVQHRRKVRILLPLVGIIVSLKTAPSNCGLWRRPRTCTTQYTISSPYTSLLQKPVHRYIHKLHEGRECAFLICIWPVHKRLDHPSLSWKLGRPPTWAVILKLDLRSEPEKVARERKKKREGEDSLILHTPGHKGPPWGHYFYFSFI